jgi:hypothetical protein
MRARSASNREEPRPGFARLGVVERQSSPTMNWRFCLPARSPAVVGADAQPQIACTPRSVDVYSVWMGGCRLQ